MKVQINSSLTCSNSFLISVAAVVFLAGFLFLPRFLSNISFFEPLQLTTTGSEEQSILSLWKFIYHQPVYSDPHRIPFNSSYLNWLFYGFYGIVIKAVLALTQLSDAWIPTLGRLITLLFSGAGVFVSRLILRELFPQTNCHPRVRQNTDESVLWRKSGDPDSGFPLKACGNDKGSERLPVMLLFWLVSFYLFFGPLPAFWPLTVRPDIAAAVFELLAFYFFAMEFQKRPITAALIATFLAFVAWSFKQANVSIFLSLIIFCFIHHRRAAWLMCFMMGTLCSLVVWLGGPAYRESAILGHMDYGFSAALAFKIFLYYLAKCAFAIPGYLAIGAVFFSKKLRDEIQRDKAYQLCFITAIVSTCWGWMTSLKIGASENYLIPTSIFVTFFCIGVIARATLPRNDMLGQIFQSSIYFSLAINAAFILLILFGVKEHVSKRYEHKENLALLRCTQVLAHPIFSQTMYLHLPWMLGGEPFILDGYWLERDREKVYERGGIEGLIKEGYFSSLVFERARINEIFGTPVRTCPELGHYAELESSGCPSTHIVFIKKGFQ